MNKEIMFDVSEIEKCKFDYSKYLININNINTDKLMYLTMCLLVERFSILYWLQS